MQGRRTHCLRKRTSCRESLVHSRQWEEILFYEKKSAWLSFTGRRKIQTGNTDWTTLLGERPGSLQPKWELYSAGSPVPPTNLSAKRTHVTTILWKTHIAQGSRCFTLAVVHHRGDINPNSKSISIKLWLSKDIISREHIKAANLLF